MDKYTCNHCGQQFDLPPETQKRYPNWQPKLCRKCFATSNTKSNSTKPKQSRKKRPAPTPLRTDEVIEQFDGGPQDGVFTDGACSGNPGPGGWGAVYVEANDVVQQEHGSAEQTTNNRMELMGLIAGLKMITPADSVTIYSDSRLCVQTINEWAAGWERRGWRRKDGPVRNLDLVQQAYELAKQRPKAQIKWIKAHVGNRWNEYADALANRYLIPNQ